MRDSAALATTAMTRCMQISRPGIHEHALAATFGAPLDFWLSNGGQYTLYLLTELGRLRGNDNRVPCRQISRPGIHEHALAASFGVCLCSFYSSGTPLATLTPTLPRMYI